MTWTDVAKKIGEEEGKRISRVRIRYVGMKALDKMREALLQDPIIVDWAIDKGYEA